MTCRPAAVALLSAAALLGAGCGEKCKSETPAKVQSLPANCTGMAPGAAVTVGIGLCPTCNQTGATCVGDTSQLGVQGSREIFLDPTVEACEDTTSCGNPNPTCLSGPVQCTFRAPSAPDDYVITVLDPLSGQTITQPFTVVSDGTQTACSI